MLLANPSIHLSSLSLHDPMHNTVLLDVHYRVPLHHLGNAFVACHPSISHVLRMLAIDLRPAFGRAVIAWAPESNRERIDTECMESHEVVSHAAHIERHKFVV